MSVMEKQKSIHNLTTILLAVKLEIMECQKFPSVHKKTARNIKSGISVITGKRKLVLRK